MAIIQISKIQVRSGNLVDLPQLDEAEFGWASDQKKLYIGKTTPNENIEILTSYSNIYFSQINGSYGNLNITTPVTGQTIAFDKDSNTWINTGGNALDPGNSSYYSDSPIHLGNVSNIYIGGGAIGYILETDGLGNLAWTPKGTITANISGATNANPVVITTSANNFFVDGMRVTITNVGGMTQLNGNSYYANVISANTFSLYSDSGLTTPVNGTGYGTYTSGGRAIASVGGTGGGGSGAGGSTYSVQYNSGGISTGDANFQWNYSTQLLSLTGTANISQNVNVTGNVTASRLVSNIATGTAPLTVSSTTQVANLNVATAGVAGTVTTAAQPNITSVGTLTSLSVSGNANVGNLGTTGVFATTLSASGNANVGNIGTAGLITATGNANVGNLGTTGVFATTLSASGNANVGNIGTAGLITATGNITGGNLATAGTLSAGGNANVGNLGTTGVFATTLSATGNANVGNLGTTGVFATTLSVTGNANVGNIGTTGVFATTLSATGNANVGNLGTTGVFATTLSASGNANVGNLGTTGVFATTLSATGNANVGNLGATGVFATTLSASGNANVGNIGTAGLVTATGNITGGNLVTAGVLSAGGNATVATLITANITTGANTTLGNITGNWVLTAGSRMQATYADLAEYYEADQDYEPGTVLEFGGEKEVTLAQDGTTKIAGVVSTNPAYVMNAGCPGIATPIALQGRVPVKVRGKVNKGDMMVSGGNGYARPWNYPQMGMVIGKSLENFEGLEGIIEIAVGRL